MPKIFKPLGEKIRNLRKSNNLTTIQLAEHLNVSNGLVNNIENGRNDVFKLELLHKIAKTFNISIYELLSNESVALDSIKLDKSNNINIKINYKNYNIEELNKILQSLQKVIQLYIDVIVECKHDENDIYLITKHIIDELNFIQSISLKNNA